MQMQYMMCLIHLDHDIENCIKYATSVEQSFRKTSGPSEVAMHWINQLMSVWSRARASSSFKDLLKPYSVNEIKLLSSTYASVLSLTIKVNAAKNLTR